MIFPIFYDVEPRDVGLETPRYCDALAGLERISGFEQVWAWEGALTDVASLRGWETGSSRPSHIVREVTGIVVKLKRDWDNIAMKKGKDSADAAAKGGDVALGTDYADVDTYGSEEVSAWEEALADVGSLRGWDTRSSRPSHIIRQVVEDIVVMLKEVRKKDEAKEPVVLIGNSYRESPVGVDRQVEDMMDLLDLEVSDVRIVGIWGKDIGATAKQLGGVRLLQSKLMSDILNREYEVDQVAKGVDFFKGILRNLKVLIVLDDVVARSDLHEIVGEKLDWFGYGSRIIVTTSIVSVIPEFISRGLAHVYGINVMNNDQALELFRKHALQRNLSVPAFDEIAKEKTEGIDHLNFVAEDFKGMPNIRFLILDCAKVADWGGWREIKMPQLKVLNLTGCADLLISPDLSSFPDLGDIDSRTMFSTNQMTWMPLYSNESILTISTKRDISQKTDGTEGKLVRNDPVMIMTWMPLYSDESIGTITTKRDIYLKTQMAERASWIERI
ncbi:hypothetical protein NL676_033172 [Syzygium grande]|nr:hypothetical protein NL676_033172 [Syzygium grande]